jgi:heat shock protein HslJ
MAVWRRVAVGAAIVLAGAGVVSVGGWPAAAQLGARPVGRWQLVKIGDRPVATRAGIAFDGSGHVSGNDSCNAFGGAVEFRADRLRIGRLAMTAIGCLADPDGVIAAMDAMLESNQLVRWTLTGAGLTLAGAGQPPLTFRG